MLNLEQIEKFVKECMDKGVEIPRNMEIICEDYPLVVPEEHKYSTKLEFNIRSETDKNKFQKVELINWAQVNYR